VEGELLFRRWRWRLLLLVSFVVCLGEVDHIC